MMVSGLKKEKVGIWRCFTALIFILLLSGMACQEAKAEAWDGTAAHQFGEGTGNADDPYKISSGEELAYLAELINAGNSQEGVYFKLINDIDLGGIDEAGNGRDSRKWTPIGSGTDDNHKFAGSFDGDGHKIQGVYVNISDNSTDYAGLFGFVATKGVITNLTVDGKVQGKYAGGIAGESYGEIENCNNTGEVTSTGIYAGGIVGDASGKIQNCYNTGKVQGRLSEN